MKKYIYLFIALLFISAVYATVTNTDVSNTVSVFAGRIGIDVANPREALDVNGSIVLGANVNNTPGTIRYLNDRFEGRQNSDWIVLNQISKKGDNDYLFNDTYTMYFNGTKLNESLNSLSTGKQGDDIFLYNDSDTMYFNETYGNTIYVYKDLNGNANLSQKNITEINAITSYYSSACSAGTFVQDIDDDGTFTCVGTGGASVGGGWANTTTTTSTALSVIVNNNDFYINTTTDRVGIQTNTPDSTLQVNGNFSSGDIIGTGNLTISNNAVVNGIVSGGTLYTTGQVLGASIHSTGVMTANGLTDSGNTILQNVTINNNMSITNDLTVSGDIFVDNITDSFGHIITGNSTCKIIQGPTSILSIC